MSLLFEHTSLRWLQTTQSDTAILMFIKHTGDLILSYVSISWQVIYSQL